MFPCRKGKIMSNFTVPYTFVGGTKARAEEVNANFSAVKDELNTKVDKNINGTVVVGDATEATHAVNKGQVESILASELVSKLDNNLSNLSSEGLRKFQYVPFSINIGNVNSDGEPDLLDDSDNTKVVFNVDENMPLFGVLADGTDFVRFSIPDLDVTELADGTYNLFLGESGACIPLKNNIFRQKFEPQPLIENAWTQPVLNSNGTLGGSSFAVYASGLSEGAAYRAFDGTVQTNQSYCCTTSGKGYIEFYNPTPIKLVSIQMYDYVSNVSYRCEEGIIYGSNDGTNWDTLTTFTQPTSTGTGNLLPVINVNSNDTYKYFKIKNEKSGTGGTSGAWVLPEIIISATMYIEGAKTGDFWLNTSVKPYKSYKYSTSGFSEFNYVPLPQSITIENGVIVSVNKNGNFSDNGYDRYLMLPDFKRSTVLTNGATYKAQLNGWIFDGGAMIKPLYIGETFTPSSSGYIFYAMKGE